MIKVTNAMVDFIDRLPEGLIWKFAKRYIAGPALSDGMNTMSELYGQGMVSSMDILGENTESNLDADLAYREYLELIDGMEKTGHPANISLKLTQLGLTIDEHKCFTRVEDIASKAWKKGFFFRLDMEDATTTDQTLDLFRHLRTKSEKVGLVIQAYLKRSIDDVRKLTEENKVNIRICKGIYKESPKIAYQDRQKVRDNFLDIMRVILDMGSYPAIATHDPFLIRGALKEIQRRQLLPENYEFQMLHGVGFKFRRELLSDGHVLRIYVPFGAAWRAYSLRRFRENPTVAFYVVKNLILPS